MKNTYKTSGWFTLIELIVAITIFSIVMVSVISIFIFASQLWGKIEINRLMQENTKNIVETIAEDIRENRIIWVSGSLGESCDSDTLQGTKLCTNTSEYFLAKREWTEDETSWIRIDPLASCQEIQDQCYVVRSFGGKIFPLSNSRMSFRDLRFYASDQGVGKVTITFHAQPAVRKWIPADLIKNNSFYFQTTISDRIISLD